MKKIKDKFSKENLRKYLGYKESKETLIADKIIITLIFLSSLFYVLETYNLPIYISNTIEFLDLLIIVIFTIEFLLRYYVVKDRIKHTKSFYTIIDFLTIFPFWVGIGDLHFLRILRFFRFFRYSKKYLKMSSSFLGKNSIEKLFIVRILFTIFTILFISSGIVYTFERPYNDKINTFDDAFYFTLVTVTTVGFGDITPVTKIGKFVTMFVIISGVIVIPWHIGQLIKYLIYNTRKSQVTCEDCGLKYHDPDAVYCKHCGARIYQETEGNDRYH